MKRGRALYAIAILLAGCRAVLGIDTLEVVDGSVDASVATDASSPIDGSVSDDHAPPPEGAPPQGGDANACASQAGCVGCCRAALLAQFPPLQDYARQTGCICGDAGQCSSACAATLCASPTNEQPVQPCGPCIDPAFISGTPACDEAMDACAHDSVCAQAARCLESCR